MYSDIVRDALIAIGLIALFIGLLFGALGVGIAVWLS